MNREAVILSLKEKLKAFSPGREESLFRSGEVPVGALSQVTGSKRMSWIVDRLASRSDLSVAWVEKTLSIFPPALAQKQVDLSSVLFVEVGDAIADWEWALLQLLDSQLFQVVVATGTHEAASPAMLRTLRRFQVAAEKSRTAAVFLSETPWTAWPIRFRYVAETSREVACEASRLERNRYDECHRRVV